MIWSLTVDRVAQPYELRDNLLSQARIKLGSLVSEPESNVIQIPFDGPGLDQKFTVEFGDLRSQAIEDLKLAIVVRPDHIKRFSCIFESELDDCPFEVTISQSVKEQLGTLKGLELALLLTSGVGIQRRIVGRRLFRILSEDEGFSIRHVWRSDEAWLEAGLPEKTAWILEEPNFASEPRDLVLYIHESLRSVLTNHESEVSTALSKQISVDVLFDLVSKVVGESDVWPPGTLGWVVVQKMQELGIERTSISLSRMSDIRAILQGVIGVAE